MDDILCHQDDDKISYIIRECFNGFLLEKTKIITSRNLNNLEKVDKIFVISNGKIVDSGSYNEIYERHQEEFSFDDITEEKLQKYDVKYIK